jgi:chromosome segregation ATPase
MFPGVRGSTKTGGTDESANKLVILNDEGLLDSSMFPDDIKEAGSVVEDLEEEVRNRIQGDEDLASAVEAEATSRRNSDVNLDARISGVERSANARITELEKAVGPNQSWNVDGLVENVKNLQVGLGDTNSRVNGAFGEIQRLDGAVTGLDSRVGGNTADIGSLEDRVSDTEEDIAEIKSGASGQEGQIDNLISQIRTISMDISNLQSSINGIGNQISSLRSDMEYQVGLLNNKISALDRRVTALEEIVMPSNY